ncbi:MAG: metal ABC transporter permease [Pseudomonadota bacterium]
MMGPEFVALSLPPLLIGICVAVACAVPGNFLILRSQALIGDAISHVVLPGIVLAFIITGSRASATLLVGAAVAAVFSIVAIDLIRRVGRIEPGAAMGVVFTTMFAGGVLLIEQFGAGSVHLDVEHALFGNLEGLIWLDGFGWASLLDPSALAGLPVELPRMAAVLVLVTAFTIVFWRPLAMLTFDEGFAQSLGLRTNWLGLALVILSAIAAVAAFEAVGSIIVIAMFICPPAAARLMTNRLASQVWMSALIAAISAGLGYVLAGYGPMWLGYGASLSAAGMIATLSGLILAGAALFGKHRHRAR